ncbi:hypothetical protein AURDEDRAFT_170933 [Auricularia subglabra TFB-10046 SS5]|nr:hypothetical protein AURDEDRAFT_170933 [Auricularia subglabra TFB-10046 SS5]
MLARPPQTVGLPNASTRQTCIQFWDVGTKLFRSPSAIHFIPADLFDDASLRPLAQAGPFAAIHVAAFFHLFPLDQQRVAARRILSSLLSRGPGSIIFGSNIGADVPGASLGRLPYLHNVESWREMWARALAEQGEDAGAWVCDAELRTVDGYLGDGVAKPKRRGAGEPGGTEMKWLVWSISRGETQHSTTPPCAPRSLTSAITNHRD